jgi:uncharacterized membrane protein
VFVMLLGLLRTLASGPASAAFMREARFDADFGKIARGCVAGDGLALVELGILMLVLTPVLRVAGSMALFAVEERDWLYTGITFVVLALTLSSLLLLR